LPFLAWLLLVLVADTQPHRLKSVPLDAALRWLRLV
jgi:hypothetical protein